MHIQTKISPLFLHIHTKKSLSLGAVFPETHIPIFFKIANKQRLSYIDSRFAMRAPVINKESQSRYKDWSAFLKIQNNLGNS